jgi:murein DD-endopeptidase MepM/ murein hydrolase activator NlpD
MAKNDFKYIIKTDLQLNTGSLKKLIEDAKTVDNAIRRHFDRNGRGITLPMSIDKSKALSTIKKDVSKVVQGYNNGQAPTIKLGVKLDQSSIDKLKREISSVKHHLNNLDNDAKTVNVSTSLKVNRGEKEKIQKQVGDIKSTITVGLRIDKNDLKAVQSQVNAIKSTVNAVIKTTEASGNANNAHSQGTSGRFGVDNRNGSRTTRQPNRGQSRALLPNVLELQKAVMEARRGLGNTNLNRLEKSVKGYRDRVENIEKEINNIRTKKTQATVNGVKYKGEKQLKQAIEDREKEIAKLVPNITKMENNIAKVRQFKELEKEYLDLFNQMSRSVQVGKSTALNKNHPVRQMVEAKGKEITDWNKLLDDAYSENRKFNNKLQAKMDEMNNFPRGKASALPRHHPLRQLAEQNTAYDKMLDEAYKQNAKMNSDRQKKVDAINTYPVGKASNLPKHHPSRIKATEMQSWNKTLSDAYKENELRIKKHKAQQEKLQGAIDNIPRGKATNLPKHHPVRSNAEELARQQKMLDALNNVPRGKSSSLPKHHPVRQRVEELNSWNSMLDDAYKANAKLEKRRISEQQKIQNAINSTPVGKASSLPKFHPVRQSIESGKNDINNAHKEAQKENRIRTQIARLAQKDSDWNNAVHRYGGSMKKSIKDDEMILRNPDASKSDKGEALERLKNNAAELSKTMGTNLQRSFEIFNRSADGSIARTRTLQFEFDRFGNVIDRSNRTMNIFKNTLAYTAVSGGFYAMVQGIQLAVTHMAQFEAQLARVDMISKSLATGELKETFAGFGQDKAVGHKVRRDTYNIAQEMGVSNTENVMPVYQQVMSRTALSGRQNAEGKYISDPQMVKHITGQILKYSSVALGPDANPQDVSKISEDMLSMYQAQFKEGTTQHMPNMDRFFDFMASMNNKGIDTNSISDAMGEIAPDIIKKGIDPNMVAGLLGSYNLSDVDATGANMSTVAKTFFGALSKAGTGSAPTVDKGLEILGIDVKKENLTQDELLNRVLERYNSDDVSDSDRQRVDQALAGINGKSPQMTPKVGKLLESYDTPYMDELREELKLSGQLDNAWTAYRKTLKVSVGQVGQELGETVELLAELGALDGIKFLIGGFKSMLQVLNAVLDGVVRLGDAFDNMFGGAGFNIPRFVAQVMALAGALKLAGTAVTALAGKKTISGIINAVGLAGLTSTTSSTTVPVGTLNGKNATLRRTVPQTPMTGKGPALGSAMGNIASWVVAGKMGDLLNPSKMFNKGNAGGVKGANVVGNLLTRFGSGLGKILPALIKFGSILARLSVVGAAIGIAGFVGKKIYESVKANRIEKRASAYTRFQKDYQGIEENPAMQADLKKDLNEWKELNAKDKSTPSSQSTYNQGYQAYGNTYQSIHGDDNKNKALDALNKKYGQYNIKYNKDSRYVYGVGDVEQDTISYQVDTGEVDKKTKKPIMQEVKFNADDQDGWKKMMSTLGAGGKTTELQMEEKWGVNTEFVKDYNKELFSVNKLTEEIDRSMKRLGMNISKIDFDFLGAENSPSAIRAKMNAIATTQAQISEEQSKLNDKKNIFRKGRIKGEAEYGRIRGKIVDSGFKTESELDDVRLEYQMALEQGDTSVVMDRYKVSDKDREKWGKQGKKGEKKLEKALAMESYLNVVHGKESFTTAEETATDAIDDNTIAMQEQARMAKELRTAYLYASSGIDVYQAKINKLNSATGKAQTLVNLADEGTTEQIRAQGDLLRSSVEQVSAYRQQLNAVESQMSSIRSQHGNQDFSINALYNPGEAGLSAEQNAYKQLLDQQYSIHDNINSSTLAIKEQKDALKEMVLNSDKYADVWERVQNRIQLVKDLNREIFDIKTDTRLVPELAQVRSAVTGESETEVKNGMYESQRDKGLEVYQKAITALANYKGDADKLKQAYQEINDTMGSEFDKAFMKPLKDLISNDFKEAGDLIHSGAKKLDDVMGYWMNTVTSGIMEQAMNTAMSTAMSSANTEFQGAIESGSAKAIPGFSSTGKAKKMTDDQYVTAYIEQQFGYKKGSAQYAAVYRNMSKDMSQSQIVKTAKKNVVPEANNGQVSKYTDEINGLFRGTKLSGYGSKYVEVGAKYGIDPRLLASISMAETGGNSAALRNKHNVSGEFSGGSLKTFKSIGESIDSMGSFLKRLYFDRGINTIPGIQAKYAPSGADNDPNNLNSNWRNNVAKYYSGMTGISTSDLLGGSAISSGGGSGGGSGVLRKGSKGESVKELQRLLGISADGIYGNKTVSAVKAFQKKNGLTADGIAGSQTMSKLGGGSSSSAPSGQKGYYGSSSKTQDVAKHYTSGGWYYSSHIGDGRGHRGVDISLPGEADNGKDALAFLGGKVGRTGYQKGGAGNYIVVVQDNGQEQKYMHLKNPSPLKKGDTVKAGDSLGQIGNTGGSFGSHLHFEMWDKNGKMLDPEKYISQWSKGDNVTTGGSSKVAGAPQEKMPTPAEIIKLGLDGLVQAVKAQAKINSVGPIKTAYYKDRTMAYGAGNIRDVLGTSGRTAVADRVLQAREENYVARYDNAEQLKSLNKIRGEYVKDANSALKKGKKDEYNANKDAVKSIDSLIKTLKDTNKKLADWDKELEKKQKEDPRLNAGVAENVIRGGHQKIRDLRKKEEVGSVDYYRTIGEVNSISNEFMTSRKKTAMMQEYWENSGQEATQYNYIKRTNAQEELNLLFKKMGDVSKILSQFAQGTDDWYDTLEDAVALQQQVVELEQRRLENAKTMFDLTGKGMNAYINQQAVVNSKEYNQGSKNLSTAKNAYKKNKTEEMYKVTVGGGHYSKSKAEDTKKMMKEKYNVHATVKQRDKKDKNSYYLETDGNLSKDRADYIKKNVVKDDKLVKGTIHYAKTTKTKSAGKMDANEQLASLQIIAGLQDNLITQMNDYRQAVVGAFKAGALSLEEYLKKMNDLRNVQNEAKENAIAMVDAISQGFEQSLANALQEGMSGGMDSAQAFMDGVKQTLASTIASQLASVVLNNTGLQSVLTSLITSFTTAATSGKPEDMVNMFNNNDFGAQLESALAPFIPLIESIVSSTDGIFSIMKDQMFNAPEGFKIDKHLYDMAKGTGFDGVKSWDKDGKNESGSPTDPKGGGDKVTVPPGKTPAGVPGSTTKPTDPVSGGGKPVGTDGKGTGKPDSESAVKNPKDNKDKVNNPPKPKANHNHGTVRRGDKGAAVKEIQKEVGVKQDGVFGPGTEAAVKKYQKRNGLKADGVVGDKTWAKIHGKGSSGGSSSGSKKPSSSGGKTKTVKSSVNFRSSPSYNGKVIRTLPKGAKVKYLGLEKGWAKVTYDGKTGYLGKDYIYHTGGIAGMRNFASASGLKSDEIQAVLRKGENVFTDSQVGAIAGINTQGSSGGDININVNVQVEGGGTETANIEKAVETAVQKALSEYKRQQRHDNLSWKGTSY